MEIQHLVLVITERDLNDLAQRHFPDDLPLEKVVLRITPEGLHIDGEFVLFVPVNFNMSWELSICDGKVAARLVSLRALGLPVTVFKSMVLKAIADAARKIRGLTCDEDQILVDVDHLAAREGVPLTSNLQDIRCEAGRIIVRGGQ